MLSMDVGATPTHSICLVTGVTQMYVIVHCKPAYEAELIAIARDHKFDYKYTDGEIDLYVEDVPYEIVDGTYQDPDEQLCEFYGINYDQVNCMELA